MEPRGRERARPRRSARDVIAAVRPIAEQLAATHDLLIWDIEFLREAGRETLRIACDRVGGVGADELALVADDLSRELDHSDAVPGEQRYVLELTSPGAERKLVGPDQFRVCVGRDARLKLGDGRVVEGKISEATQRVVEIETGEDTVRVFFDDITKAHLIVRGF